MGTVGDRAFNDNDEITFLGSTVPWQTAKFTVRREEKRLPLSLSRSPWRVRPETTVPEEEASPRGSNPERV